MRRCWGTLVIGLPLLLAAGVGYPAFLKPTQGKLAPDPGDGKSQVPVLAMDATGRAYLAWLDERNGRQWDLYVNSSADGGNSWQLRDTLLVAAQPDTSRPTDPALAAANGKAFAAWASLNNDKTSTIHVTSSDDGGTTWSPVRRRVNNTLGRGVIPKLAADDGGHVYVTWFERGATRSLFDIYANASSDSGNTWLPEPVRLNTGGPKSSAWLPDIQTDGAGHVYVVWFESGNNRDNAFLNVSADYGKSWLSRDIQVSHVERSLRVEHVRMATSGKRHVYVVWADGRNGQTDIYFNVSADHGTTWLASDVRLDTSPPGSSLSSWPAISATPGGHVYVVWVDQRNGKGDIYLNRSADYGRTWLPRDVRLDTDQPGVAHSQAPQIASHRDGRVVVVWQDNRTGRDAIYSTASTDHGATWLKKDRQLDTEAPRGRTGVTPRIAGDERGQFVIAWEVGFLELDLTQRRGDVTARTVTPAPPKKLPGAKP